MAASEGGRISRTIQYIRTEPGLLRNVIAIGVVVLLGLIVGGTILSQQRFTPPWQSRGYVWATFTEAPSVAPGLGQSVRINGVEVGQIDDAQVDNRGRALLLLSLQKSMYDRPIYQNATLVMRPTTPLNTMYIEMDPGSPPAPEVPDYGVLPQGNAVPPIEIDQPLSHLDQNTRDATATLLSQADVALAQAPRDLPGGINAVADTTKSLQPIVAQLDARRQKLSQLVTSLAQISQTVGGDDVRLTSLANSLQTTLSAVAKQNDALRDSFNQLPGVTTSLQQSTGSVQGLADQLDPTLNDLRAASATLPTSLNKLGNTATLLDTTLQKARPVADKLPGTAGDLRPLLADVNRTIPDLTQVTGHLDTVTARLVPKLGDLTSFVYNSASLLDDKPKGDLRALVQGGPGSVPFAPSELFPGQGITTTTPNTAGGGASTASPGTNTGTSTGTG